MLKQIPVLIVVTALTSGCAIDWVLVGVETGLEALLAGAEEATGGPSRPPDQSSPCVEAKTVTLADGTKTTVYRPLADQSQCPK